MRFKDVFSIIGPGMIGPSSSHTAGAVRIGRVARELLGSQPERVVIRLYRSFADTYRGHGTDVALAAGLLGWDTDHDGIPQALVAAEQAGMELSFVPKPDNVPHPNTAALQMHGGGRELLVTGTSIGGGNIAIVGIDEFDVRFSGSFPTLVLRHADRIGLLADVTRLLSAARLNIGQMNVDRTSRSGAALTVVETDGPLPRDLVRSIARLEGVSEVRKIDLTKRRRRT
ncbi:L-serine ammonia-lyase, iron-sulfur-dependent, subunit beta [Paenibacillus sp. IB182496]|uniref:L-serine deaminase n=1 Tax=Paenibacillus sabuli TaxID=2772509 RepID=A0A927GQF1_9BACL|nr:L-serine ammonia-lyase, iron-sulfur-dependent subunit beta [Paenibacillus sabuli]MBD2843825.1 L-serine ammonia-lyase, iron-sulfur-dependent, subunit beta [Paenibacillus sabuli]